MAEDFRYETALRTALALLHRLAVNPAMPRPERLAVATYLILDAIGQVEERAAVDHGPLLCPHCREPFRERELSLQSRSVGCRTCGCGTLAWSARPQLTHDIKALGQTLS